MSSNLRNKRYVVRNKQRSKEEYAEEMKNIKWGSFKEVERLRKEFQKLMKSSLHKFADLIKTTDCTGDNIENSENSKDVFNVYDTKDVRFCDRMFGIKDAYDIYGAGEGSELIYESVAATYGTYNSRFVDIGDTTRDSSYTDYCLSSSDLFGCVSLRNKRYCILNKQYDEKEFEEMKGRVIKHMSEHPYVDKKGREYRFGEFFPPELSPFAYNETIAQEYFTLTKEEAESRGFLWRAPDSSPHKSTLEAADLPDGIKDAEDTILDEAIECGHRQECNHQCTLVFKLTPDELEFYRRMDIPLPRLCPNCRHHARLAQKGPSELWSRRCMCDYNVRENSVKHSHHPDGRCPHEFETTYAPETEEVVYCKECYEAEVV